LGRFFFELVLMSLRGRRAGVKIRAGLAADAGVFSGT
jgi:hypothetical protein